MAQKVEKPVADKLGRRHGDMFQEGFSFSGFERDMVALNVGSGAVASRPVSSGSGGGRKYLDISGVSGADSIGDGRASVYADFDNDGDLDIFLTAKHGPANLLFRNEAGQNRHWIRVALEGRKSGRDAFGAVVRVKTPAGIQTRIKSGGTGFLSQGDPRLVFGLGDAERVEWIDITWPSGLKQRLGEHRSNESLLVIEGEDRPSSLQERRFKLPDPVDPNAKAWGLVRVKKGQKLPAVKLERVDRGVAAGADAKLEAKANAAGDGVAANASKMAVTELSALLKPGRPALINLWATWCRPCAREMPELERLSRRYGDRLQVVGVSLDGAESRGQVPRTLERLGVTYPVYAAKVEALGALLSSSQPEIPLSILVGGDGKVLEVFSGWSRESRRGVDAVLGGKLAPAGATSAGMALPTRSAEAGKQTDREVLAQ